MMIKMHIKYANMTPQRSLEVWKKNHDLTGKTFGKLKVIKFIKFKKIKKIKKIKEKDRRRAIYLCKCKCGGSKIVEGQLLPSGGVKSCGCIVKSKYKMDEKYFEKINREDKAYFLGLIITDGNVDTKGKRFRMSLSLHDKDKDILETFKKYLKTDRPLIKHLSKTKYYGKIKISASLRWALYIGIVKMINDLLKLGIYRNKTKTIGFPTNRVVPHRLMRHFIRGVFDGDGTSNKGYYSSKINKNKSVSRTIQITSGSPRFLSGFQKYLRKYGITNTGISKYNRTVKATGTLASYGVLVINASLKKNDRSGLIRSSKTGRYRDAAKSSQALNQKKLFHLIYDNCSKDLYLKRKRLKLKHTVF